MKLLILGPQGSGKGTQAERISQAYGIPAISTGQLIRNQIAKKTPLGKQIEGIITKGDLIDDALAFQLVVNRIAESDCVKGFILDGFPRNVEQAKLLAARVKLNVVIYLHVPDTLVVERIGNRITCTKCGRIYNATSLKPKKSGICDACGGKLEKRADDNEEAIRHRLEQFHEKTSPLLTYYGNQVKRFDGSKSINQVEKELLSFLKPLRQ